jgi:SPP1 family predicted phage head-tail adaptor
VSATFDPGWLRHRVSFAAPSGTADAAGGESLAFAPVATVWAGIAPAGLREEIVAEHLSGVVSHLITIRFRDDISGGMRATYRGRTFRVLAVRDPDERRRYLIVKAAEETK